MRSKSALTLAAKWKSRPWYHKPSGQPGEPQHPQDDLNLRLRRVLSWLGRAEKDHTAGDCDAAFIFYWIAFNAMYGQLGTSSVDDTYERDRRRDYFDRIVAFADAESAIYDTIWSVLQDDIERMLENRYVYEPYWRHHNNPAEDRDWQQRFDSAREQALDAIRRTRTKDVLRELFFRLNTLRNQLIHGGATWSSSVNRHQVEPGARIMASLVPHFIDVMIEHPNAGWGSPRYPVVREEVSSSGWAGAG